MYDLNGLHEYFPQLLPSASKTGILVTCNYARIKNSCGHKTRVYQEAVFYFISPRFTCAGCVHAQGWRPGLHIKRFYVMTNDALTCACVPLNCLLLCTNCLAVKKTAVVRHSKTWQY